MRQSFAKTEYVSHFSRQSKSREQPSHVKVDPTDQPAQINIWKSPWLWIGFIVALIVAGIPFVEEHTTRRVIAILASDVSDSGLADPSVGESICRAQTQVLKLDDVAIDIAYAEKTEALRGSQVNNVTQMFPRCKVYVKQQRPQTLGHSEGTSPVFLLERIQTQIQIQRKAGNINPIATLIWLQAAEPGPGLPPLDFDLLEQQIKQITDDDGWVTIIGPTGTLRENLEKLSAQNPRLKVCSIAEHKSCIRNTFESARALSLN